MAHVSQKLRGRIDNEVDFDRYRKLQILSILSEDADNGRPQGEVEKLWSALTWREKIYAARLRRTIARSNRGDDRAKAELAAIRKGLDMHDYPLNVAIIDVGGFSKLPELFRAIEGGFAAHLL